MTSPFPWVTRLGCAALLAIATTSTTLAQGRPASVSTETTELRPMAETVMIFGEVVAGRESAVASRIAGIVVDVPVAIGETVQAGDVLARLDTELLAIRLNGAVAQVELAEAGVEVATASLEQATRAYERAQSLAARSAIAGGELEDRASAVTIAQGALAEAEARLFAAEVSQSQMDYEFRNAEIRAPFDGSLLEVTADLGQYITQGAQVARLLDTGALEIEANVPAIYISALEAGLGVKARTDSGAELALEIRALLPSEFAATRTRPVRFTVMGETEPDALGQSVTLDLPISAPREVLTVPKDALVQGRGGWTVFVNQEGKAVPRPVTVGAAIGSRFEVLTGLAPGDEVVVRGNERLRPMQDIAPRPAGPPQGGQASANNASERPQVSAN